MSMDFPNPPVTVGTLYPQPPVAGQPVYKWDGAKWVSTGQTGAFGIFMQDAAPSTTTTAPGSLWWETDTGILYILYNDGDSIQWVVAVPVPDASRIAVRYDTAQGLTDAQQTQGRQNIYAAPFSALAFNGMQVNGGMEISQINGANAVAVGSPSGPYILDQWAVACNGPSLSAQQVTDAPPGYSASLKASVTTADPTPGTNDHCQIITRIEGARIARLAFGTSVAVPFSFGFWVKANRPGNYGGVIGGNNLSYIFAFTINNSATWEYKTVTIQPSTSGTWYTDNRLGLEIHWAMLSGSAYQAAPGSWIAATLVGPTGMINGAAATTDYMQITGLVVLPGIELPSALRAPFLSRSWDQEYQLCQRYLYRWNGGAASRFALGYADTATSVQVVSYTPGLMRVVPTLQSSNMSANGGPLTAAAVSFYNLNIAHLSFNGSGFGTGVIYQIYPNTGGGSVTLDARF